MQAVFENKAKMWQYIWYMVLFAILLTLSLLPLIHAEASLVISYTLFQSVLLAVTCFLLLLTIMYGKFNNLPLFQRLVNYTALLVLHISVILAGGYGIGTVIFGNAANLLLLPILPTLGFLVVLVDMLQIMYFRNFPELVKEDELAVSELVEIQKDEPEENVAVEVIERVAVKSGQKIHVIMTPDIVCLQADGDYVQIFTMQGKYLKEQTMKYFEEHLPSAAFVRVHRSCIVNIEAISRIDLYEKQTQQLTLKNGQQIKVSQSGYKLLRSKLAL